MAALKAVKPSHTLSLVATICLALIGCNKAVDEKTALLNFKTEFESADARFNEAAATIKNDHARTPVIFEERIDHLKAIKTDSLPSDLKTAWSEMLAVMVEECGVFKDLPKGKPARIEIENCFKKMKAFEPKESAAWTKLKKISDDKYHLHLGTTYPAELGEGGSPQKEISAKDDIGRRERERQAQAERDAINSQR